MFLLVLLGEWVCGSSKLLSFLFSLSTEGSETGEEGIWIETFPLCIYLLLRFA